MPRVSIIIPIIRPEKAERCIKLIKKNAGFDDYEIISEEDTERIGCPKMVKRLVEKSNGELVCFLGDDCLPDKGFLYYAIQAMDAMGWGLVGLNDMTGRTIPCHWLASKKLLPHLDGEFFYTGYSHNCCDVELWERCLELRRYDYCKESIVMHDHFLLTGGEPDEHNIRAYSRHEEDKCLLAARRDNGWPT